jgi:ribosomal protein S27E
MSFEENQPVVRTALLMRCANCASGLVQPAEVAQDADGVLVRRRCPDCGHQDLVEADPDLVYAWLQREARIRVELRRTADRIARAPRIELAP